MKAIDLSKVRNSRLLGEMAKRLNPERRQIKAAKQEALEIVGKAAAQFREIQEKDAALLASVERLQTRSRTLLKRCRALEGFLLGAPGNLGDLLGFIEPATNGRGAEKVATFALLRKVGGKLVMPSDDPELYWNHDERIAVEVKDGVLTMEIVKVKRT